MPRPNLLALIVMLSAAACGGPAQESRAPSAPSSPAASSGSAVERWFPLEPGKMYTYATQNGVDRGTVSMKVERPDAMHGRFVVVGSNATKRFVYTKDSVGYDGGALLLKGPLEVGTSWPGEHGGTAKITAADATVTVPAGTYASCVQTTEDATVPQPARFVSTYCPGIGMVSLDVTSNAAEAHAELTSYGVPVKMAEGTTLKVEKAR